MRSLAALTAPLLVAVLALVAMPAPAADQLLETITVNPGATTVTSGTVTLQAGKTYKLKVTGTFRNVGKEGYGYEYDGLYCVAGVGFAEPQCQDHARAAEFQVTTGTKFDDIDRFGATTQAYSAEHSYTVSFSPPATGKLKAGMYIARTNCTSCQTTTYGEITIEVFGAGSTGGGGGGGGGGGTTTVSDGGPTVCLADGKPEPPANKRCAFGEVGVKSAPPSGKPVDLGSEKLPAKTRSVQEAIDLQNAEFERDAAAVAAVFKDPRFPDLLGMCIVFSGVDPDRIWYDEVPSPLYLRVFTACGRLVAKVLTLPKKGRSAASGCPVHLVAVWRGGDKPTRSERAGAAKLMRSKVEASCTHPHRGRIDLSLKARKGTLNKMLGARAQTAYARRAPAGQADGSAARLAFSWGVAGG